MALADLKTASQLMTYAQGGDKAAAGICPKSQGLYRAAYYMAKAEAGSWFTDEDTIEKIRAALQKANEACHTERFGPGSKQIPGVVATKTGGASTGGRVVTPVVKTPATPPTAVAKAGFSPWLLIGGLGLAVLLFGKKGKR